VAKDTQAMATPTRGFGRLAAVTAGFTLVLVTMGGTVRATDSGLACPVVATGGRLLAAAGLAVYAAGATVVCAGVLRAARRARPSAHARALTAVCVWFPLAAWANVAVVAAGEWQLLDAVGAVLLAGVLAQAILAALGYFAPMLRGADPSGRTVVRDRLEVLGRLRPAAFNVGVVAIAVAAAAGHAAGQAGAALLRGGWLLVALVLASTVVLAVTSRPRSDPDSGSDAS
jgi:nitrite reductase (NO-forming)